MEIAIKIIQFVLSLSILIIIHELGHFLTARYFKTRVEKFYLFFNPWFSIFKKKIGDTEYGVGWLPLGGYVKISGMIDESMDKEQMNQPPQPWEFRSKPAWQRLIIMLGGVTFNLLLAILIYVLMLSITGDRYLPTENLRYGIVADSLAQNIGLQSGDKIKLVNGEKLDDFDDILLEFSYGSVKNVTVERNNKLIELSVPQDFYQQLISTNGKKFIGLREPFIIDSVQDDSPAHKAGILSGDHIIGFNQFETMSFYEFRNLIQNYKGQEIDIIVSRNEDKFILPLKVNDKGEIGVYRKQVIELKTNNYNFLSAIPAGTKKAWKTTKNYVRGLGLLFKPGVKATESLGGFVTIGSHFAPTWDWEHFWMFTAFLSIILAIMNVMPIPALDGGHVMFLLYEIVAGRKPSDKFMEYAQTVGMVLLLGLIIFAQYNDVMRLFNN